MPEKTSATVSVSTFSGDFSSSFPLQLSETRRGKRFSFTIGRPGEAMAKDGKHHDEDDPDEDN
jgi:hypothetical protein